MTHRTGIKKDGRVQVRTDDGKTMNRARHRMEQYLGRELRDDEVVHHKNENPSDDRIENLEVMDKSEHVSHHHAGSSREYPEYHETPRIPEIKERLIREIADYMERKQGSVNKSEVARAVDVSDMTVHRYVKG